jgi:hypothetical protein
MVVDDLVVCGAEPLFMTDYIAVGKVFPERIAEIVSGIAKGCAKAGTALVGGETAEHPGLLGEDEFDIAGAATGAVDYENLLGAEKIKAGDVIIAMPASGIHANGFSLVRHILKTKNLKLNDTPQDFTKTLGEVLLTPTEIYSLDCLALIKGIKTDLHAFTHITGGGIADNTARVIPAGLKAVYDRSTWALPTRWPTWPKSVASPSRHGAHLELRHRNGRHRRPRGRRSDHPKPCGTRNESLGSRRNSAQSHSQQRSKRRSCVGSQLRHAITFGSEELITYKARRRSRAWGEADKKQKPHESHVI